MESLEGLTEFAKFLRIPCVGGKVSFYNETSTGPIKPTPLIGVLGITDNPLISTQPSSGDYIVIIGKTNDELGGSEYYEYIHKFVGGTCPTVNFKESKTNMLSVLSLIKNKLVNSVHDCSKGGFVIALTEISIFGKMGCEIDLANLPSNGTYGDEVMLFSESHSRYLLSIDKKNIDEVRNYLTKKNVPFGILGKFSGDQIRIMHKSKYVTKYPINIAEKKYFNTLEELLKHG
jgi:phosphoribosylformylglycinamidine synthase